MKYVIARKIMNNPRAVWLSSVWHKIPKIQTSRHGFSENFTAESLVGNILLLMAKGSSNDM